MPALVADALIEELAPMNADEERLAASLLASFARAFDALQELQAARLAGPPVETEAQIVDMAAVRQTTARHLPERATRLSAQRAPDASR